MPFKSTVLITRDPTKISDKTLGSLSKSLPIIVSHRLSVQMIAKTQIGTGDVKVHFKDYEPGSTHAHPLTIVISAKDSPELREVLEKRKGLINKDIGETGQSDFQVEVQLSPR